MDMQDYERLMRYADGEVDEAERLEIEVWLAGDAEARQIVGRLRGERGAIRAAFQRPGAATESGALIDAVDGAFAARHVRKRSMRWAMAVAASLALAVATGAASLFIAEQRIDAAVQALAVAQARDRAFTTAALEEALETRVSGETVSWANPDTGVTGSVTPTRTFRGAGDSWCREYRREVHGIAFDDVTVGIACRVPAGENDDQLPIHWFVAVERPANA